MYISKYGCIMAGLLLLLLSGCQTESIEERAYPIVMTLEPELMQGAGVRLFARITSGELQQITEYGFVWGTSTVLNLTDSEKITFNGSPVEGSYSHDITEGLEFRQNYYVRSYIRWDEIVFYGNMTGFTPP
jgi:hypothetical protein